jgi:hypothetical protein
MVPRSQRLSSLMSSLRERVVVFVIGPTSSSSCPARAPSRASVAEQL